MPFEFTLYSTIPFICNSRCKRLIVPTPDGYDDPPQLYHCVWCNKTNQLVYIKIIKKEYAWFKLLARHEIIGPHLACTRCHAIILKEDLRICKRCNYSTRSQKGDCGKCGKLYYKTE
ncbi:hypothetical protein PAEPH01_2162 [Pancytospora epiphaga]|nr:hypothetical protein PAEPH01_2162 [Pancytospora epiphaga]